MSTPGCFWSPTSKGQMHPCSVVATPNQGRSKHYQRIPVGGSAGKFSQGEGEKETPQPPSTME